jgi:hypothetical protein
MAIWDGIVKKKIFSLLKQRGWPEPSKPGWSCQADVEGAVTGFLAESNKFHAESTVRKQTSRLMESWKSEQKPKPSKRVTGRVTSN